MSTTTTVEMNNSSGTSSLSTSVPTVNTTLVFSPTRRVLRRRNSSNASIHQATSPTYLSPKTSQGSLKETSIRIELTHDEENGCLICMDSFTNRRRPYPIPCIGKCTGAFVHYRCIMAWLGQSGSCPLCRGECDPLTMEPFESLDFSNITNLVITPIPLDAGIIRCYVKQIKRGLLKQSTYELYLQSNNGISSSNTISPNSNDRFLLAAKQQIRSNMTTNYIISTDKEEFDNHRVGRMGSNFLGTVFTIYDNGRDPQKIAKIQDSGRNTSHCSTTADESNVLQIREELGCITYEANRTSVGPRKMRVCIPQVDEVSSSTKVCRPLSRRDRLVNRLNQGEMQDLRKFTNREPVFREDLGAYCLDFGGRVSMASVKNFQLIAEDDVAMGNILQFGRVSVDMFTLDFQWPLSPFQAFAICLSSCDTKLACV